MKKPIDVSSRVMSRIKQDNIQIRPRRYFVMQRTLKVTALCLLGLLFVACVAALTYSLKNNAFSEYLHFGKFGFNQAVRSLPWAAIVITGSLVVALLSKIRKVPHKQLFAIAPGLAALVLLFGVGISLAWLPGTGSMARNVSIVLRNGEESVVLSGQVEETIGNSLKLKLTNGKIVTIILSNSVLTSGGKPLKGAKVMVLGNQKGNIITASIIKLLEQPPMARVELLPSEVPKPAETPVPAPQTPVVTAPKPVPTVPKAQAPASTPVPATRTITITSVSGPYVNGTTTKYLVSWTANFASAQGYKLVWNPSPNPVYPGSPYYFYSTPDSSSGSGYVKGTTGSGTHYVRVCEYLGGTCGLYSNETSVTF